MAQVRETFEAFGKGTGLKVPIPLFLREGRADERCSLGLRLVSIRSRRSSSRSLEMACRSMSFQFAEGGPS